MPDPTPPPPPGGSTYRGFLREFFRDRRTVGAVAPTTRWVSRRMAQLGDVAAARAVAEFGAGSGAITRELLAALPAGGRLWAFEIVPRFIEDLREAFDDPRLVVVPESVETVEGVREREVEAGFDAIISSLPFSLIGPDHTREILRVVSRTLRPGGIFVALQYHPRFLFPLLRSEFWSVEREVYPWNIPPAMLLRARNPRHVEAPRAG